MRTHQVFIAVALCLALSILAIGWLRASKPEGKVESVPEWQSSSQPPIDPVLRKAVERIARPMVASGRRVGVVVGIIDGDKRWVFSYGRKALDSDTPPDGDTVYEIGSVTKTFTAASLAVLDSRGTVSLTDPVSRFLPDSVRVPSYQGKQITLEHLAVHTSGLPRMPGNFHNFDPSPMANPYAAYSAEDMYKFLTGYRLKHAPGEKCEYSNLGAGLLGLALARASKATYESMVTELICRPLDLKDTVVTLSKDQRARLAPAHTLKRKGSRIVPAGNWTLQDCFAGAGALRSTANDMLTYLAANIGTTQTPLGKALQTMQAARHKEDDTSSMGLAWQIQALGTEYPSILWHNGGTGGYCSFIGFCRERKVGVVVLSNTSSLEDDEQDEDVAGFKLLLVLMDPELVKHIVE